jgi:hypothetical protein
MTAERRGGEIVEVRVTGGAVVACRGEIDIPDHSKPGASGV